MAQFTNNAIQAVESGQNIILNTSIRCPRGYVIYDGDTGLITLRGIVNNPTACFTRYQLTFNGNIAIPADGTAAEEISIALSQSGVPLQISRARVTPAVVDTYWNVTSTAIITVPRGCCVTIAVENTSEQTINVQNASLLVSRMA